MRDCGDPRPHTNDGKHVASTGATPPRSPPRLRRRSASAVEVTITLTTLPIPAATAGALTPAARAIATTALP